LTADQDAADEAVNAFWNEAKRRIHLEEISVYTGPSPLAAVPPPAWSWGEGADADAFVDDLLARRLGETRVAVADYEAVGEQHPEPGALSIVLDGAGRARVLVVTSDVTVDGTDVVQALKVLYTA